MSPQLPPQTGPEPAYSLRKRLVLAFGVLLILFLGLAGFVLDQAFKRSVMVAQEERLQLQIYALLGVAEPEEGAFFVPDLEEARFSQLNSGLYGFILDSAGRELWRSPSALDLNLNEFGLDYRIVPGSVRFGAVESEDAGSLTYALYDIFWASRSQEYRFVVLSSNATVLAEIKEFESNLWFWLGGMALLLSLVQYLLLRWGLKPLKALARDVRRIEVGQSERLEGKYPRELQALTRNMNLLIHTERERQKRYQTTLGDLAHSLKTPLAVINGIVQKKADDRDREHQEISEQVQRMNQIVSYQLKRAAQSGSAPILAKPVNAGEAVEKILRTLEKVYQDKHLNVRSDLQRAFFYGEESDLMEVCGNVLDNAFKYTESQVSVIVREEKRSLLIQVEDDGPGIADAHKARILERGERADTMRPGQGIGLAVVADIVSNYQGQLEIDASPLDGASIRLIFPYR